MLLACVVSLMLCTDVIEGVCEDVGLVVPKSDVNDAEMTEV